jgi:SAM-dependent MidA family methyltransferase
MPPDFDELPAPSSLLSSRWSRDNLVTMRPGRLYDGQVLERVEQEMLETLVQELEKRIGPLRVGAGRMGVLTWDIACEGVNGPFVLQVPRVLDEAGSHARATRDVPRRNSENMRYFRERGLGRFLPEPRELLELAHGVPAALFAALPEHRSLGFGRGAVQVELSDGALTWLVGLGAHATADVLAELVAALAYHYEPELGGGTAVADVIVNDGDFALRRRADGSFDLRLTALRRREPRIDPHLLILYSIQLLAYEDWTVDRRLTGLPTLMSNPSVAFAGLVRGRRYRERDLGRTEQSGEAQALDWIRAFGRSREGRAYRPWVDRFLAGRLPLSFGDDLREHWWRVVPLETRCGLLELKGRTQPGASDAASARALRHFLERLVRDIGRGAEDEPEKFRLNDAGLEAVERLLEEARVPAETRAAVTEALFSHWPYRGLDQLLARVPEARGLRRMKSRLTFGQVVAGAEQGTVRSLAPGEQAARPCRLFVNREIYGTRWLAPPLAPRAVDVFPSFEAYMDAALHEPKWGYYAQNVVIGAGGHFVTHPEELTPHYGRWLAIWAFKAWRDLRERAELAPGDPFPIIEFGAGNGRLARDVVDAIAARAAAASPEQAAWTAFAACMRYHIYETSESLRERQRQLLGDRASIAPGDARRPAETLRRDFPQGVRGFFVTNEVPDAFGVHKVALAADGVASAALVVPRVERECLSTVLPELSGRALERDTALRHEFAFDAHPGDLYVDHATFLAMMDASSGLAARERAALLGSLWFEEVYVPAAAIPELAVELAANASDYAVALAADDTGVVLYVNVHAARFVREIGACLSAGFAVTIDYGDTTFGLVQGARRGDFPFRVYRDALDHRPRPNDPYAAPGTQDMTADVNFTALARAGRGAGLELVHFGPERDVCGEELPELARTSAELSAMGKFLGSPVFKVLVLGTRASGAFVGPLSSPLPLTHRERDLAKGRREAVAGIERALSNLWSAPPR